MIFTKEGGESINHCNEHLSRQPVKILGSNMMCTVRNCMDWVRNKNSQGLGDKKRFPVTSKQEGFLSHHKLARSTSEPQRSPPRSCHLPLRPWKVSKLCSGHPRVGSFMTSQTGSIHQHRPLLWWKMFIQCTHTLWTFHEAKRCPFKWFFWIRWRWDNPDNHWALLGYTPGLLSSSPVQWFKLWFTKKKPWEID